MNVSIRGLDKAELLAALYNYASPVGMGWARSDPNVMTTDEARVLLDRQHGEQNAVFRTKEWELYFDYVKGRPLKVNLTGDVLDTGGYDRDQGRGEGARIVAELHALADKKNPLPANAYRCCVCLGCFTKIISDDVALEETRARGVKDPVEELLVGCENCYREMCAKQGIAAS